uniref:Uncharacterized protein n=1 Tax=Anguilla anguilla TaxID=7936 RepID=A0A0E9WCQ1_ANGAN
MYMLAWIFFLRISFKQNYQFQAYLMNLFSNEV